MPSNPIPMRLKEARMSCGISQKELGIRAGIDEFSASPRINQYENGKHTPNYATLVQLSHVLNVPVPYFYCEDDRLARIIVAYGKLSAKEQSLLIAELEAK
jgi:transcriptional regulator with XRE-family HTH domain